MKPEIKTKLLYPDPFQPAGVEFELPEAAVVTVTLVGSNGTILRTLTDSAQLSAGTHVVEFESHSAQRDACYLHLEVSIHGEVLQFTRPLSAR